MIGYVCLINRPLTTFAAARNAIKREMILQALNTYTACVIQ